MSQSTEPAGTTRRRFTKIRAILAGGLVLGVGAAITLAVWNDSEVATGDFAAGNFGIVGSTDGGVNFDEHPSEPSAATLNFDVSADTLAPGDTVYASFAVQLTDTSDYGADVTVTQDIANALTGTSASYAYTTNATCDEAAFGAGDDTGSPFSLTALDTPVYVCFQVTAGPTLVQGDTGSITWTFAAQSTDALTTP